MKERPPSVHKPVLERAGKEGISMATLYKWHKQARMEAPLLPDRSAVEGGSSQSRFAAVVVTARDWVLAFVRWYNLASAHRHSGIRFVTLHQRHQGLLNETLEPYHGNL